MRSRARTFSVIVASAALVITGLHPVDAAPTQQPAVRATHRVTGMRITVDTPKGVAVNVQLRGPRTRYLGKPAAKRTATFTEALPHGTYRVVPESVNVAGTLYVGTAKPSRVAVHSGHLQKATVRYHAAAGSTHLAVTTITATAVDLTWSAPKGATFALRRASGSHAPASRRSGHPVAVRATTRTARDQKLSAGHRYSYALFTHYRGAWTGPLTVTVGTAPSAHSSTATYVARPTTLLSGDARFSSVQANGATVLAALASGQVAPVLGTAVVLPASPVVPHGFLGKVTALSADGRTLTLAPATASDAFDTYSIDVAFSHKSITLHAAHRSGVKAPADDGDGKSCAELGGGASIDLHPSLSLSGHFSYHLTKKFGFLTGAQMSMDLEATVVDGLDISASAELSCSLPGLDPISIPIAPEPVPIIAVLQPKAEVSVGGAVKIKNVGVTATAGFKFSAGLSLTHGVSVDASPIASARQLVPKTTSEFDVGLTLGGELTIGPGFTAEDAGVVAGVSGELDPLHAELSAEFAKAEQTCLSADISYDARLGLAAKAWVGPFSVSDEVTLLSASLPYPGFPIDSPTNCSKDLPKVSTTSLPVGSVGDDYDAELDADGGSAPLTWSITKGTLPDGLTLSDDGTITGTPTTAGSTALTFEVSDVYGHHDSVDLALTVAAAAVDPGSGPGGGGGGDGAGTIGVVPVACDTACATSWGDPHLTSFDGAVFDAQLVGELVLAKSTVDDLQIQVRQQPYNGSRVVAGNVALAAMVAGHPVALYLENGAVTARVDHALVADPSSVTLPGGGTLTVDPSADLATITWPDGTQLGADYSSGYFALTLGLAAARHGKMTGILGNANGDPSDDFTARSGAVVPPGSSATDIRNDFLSTWRVRPSESLFDYPSGEGTADFTDPNFPYADVTVADLPTQNAQDAQTLCANAGVSDPATLNSCTLDVALSGNGALAQQAANSQAAVSTTSGRIVAASAAGEAWTDTVDTTAGLPTSGTSALTYGQSGCTAIDANSQCTGGAWTVVPGAPWMWTGQFTTDGQHNVTFTDTVPVTAAQAAQPLTLTAAADDSVSVTVDGNTTDPVLTAGYNSPVSVALTLSAGQHTLTFQVNNDDGDDPQSNPAGLAWKLVTN